MSDIKCAVKVPCLKGLGLPLKSFIKVKVTFLNFPPYHNLFITFVAFVERGLESLTN